MTVEDARPEDLSAVGALWNANYDLGLGLGPLLLGMVLVRSSSPPTALMLVVCTLAACLPPARRWT